MKTFVVLLCLIIPFGNSSAQTLTDVARSKELTWFGIDFSISRFIGFSKDELKDNVPVSWCYTILSDGQLNMIKKAYGKKSLLQETTTTGFRDNELDCKSLTTDKAYFLKIDNINKVVEEYHFTGKGYGVLFVVESVEKVSNSIFIWVVYINKENGKIISSRRYIGSAWSRDSRRGDYYSDKGIKLIIKTSGNDLKQYKN